ARSRGKPRRPRDRDLSLRPHRGQRSRQSAGELPRPKRSCRFLRRLQHVAGLAGDGMAHVLARPLRHDARDEMDRLRQAERAVDGKPPGASTNTLPNTVTDNSVDSRVYLSWSGSYDFPRADGRALQVFWVVNNLLDRDPPVAPGGNLYPTNPVFFDTIGRRFRAGVRFAF